MDEQHLKRRTDDQFRGSLKKKKKLLAFKTVGGVIRRRWSQENFTNNKSTAPPWAKGKKITGNKKLKKFKQMFEDDDSDEDSESPSNIAKEKLAKMKAKKTPGNNSVSRGKTGLSKQTKITGYASATPGRTSKTDLATNLKTGLKYMLDDGSETILITGSMAPPLNQLTPNANTLSPRDSKVLTGRDKPSLDAVMSFASNQRRKALDIASGLAPMPKVPSKRFDHSTFSPVYVDDDKDPIHSTNTWDSGVTKDETMPFTTPFTTEYDQDVITMNDYHDRNMRGSPDSSSSSPPSLSSSQSSSSSRPVGRSLGSQASPLEKSSAKKGSRMGGLKRDPFSAIPKLKHKIETGEPQGKSSKSYSQSHVDTIASIRSALEKMQGSEYERIDLEEFLQRLMSGYSETNSKTSLGDAPMQAATGDAQSTDHVHARASAETKPRPSVSVPAIPASNRIQPVASRRNVGMLKSPKATSNSAPQLDRKLSFHSKDDKAGQESLPSLTPLYRQAASDTRMPASEKLKHLNISSERFLDKEKPGKMKAKQTRKKETKESRLKSRNKQGTVMFLPPKIMETKRMNEASAIKQPSLQKVKGSRKKACSTDGRTMEAPYIHLTLPSSEEAHSFRYDDDEKLPATSVKWRNTIEVLYDNDTLNRRKSANAAARQAPSIPQSSITDTGEFSELHIQISSDTLLPQKIEIPRRDEIETNEAKRERSRSSSATSTPGEPKDKDLPTGGVLGNVARQATSQPTAAVKRDYHEPEKNAEQRRKPQLKQIDLEEGVNAVEPITSDKSVQLSMASMNRREGHRRDAACHADAKVEKRRQTTEKEKNKEAENVGRPKENGSPLEQTITNPSETLTDADQTTDSQSAYETAPAPSTMMLRVPRPSHISDWRQQREASTVKARDRTMNWTPAFELLRDAKERAQREGRYQYSERLGRYIYLSDSDHENDYSSDSSSSSTEEGSRKGRGSVPKVFRRSCAPASDGKAGEMISPHGWDDLSRNLDEDDVDDGGEERWSDSDDMEYESWLSRRTRIPLVWVHWEKRRAMKRLEKQFKEPVEPLHEIAKHFDESELEIYAHKLKAKA